MKSLITALVTFSLLLLSGITSALPTDINNTTLVDRGHCFSIPCSSVVGDGNPHQWILHKQLSPLVDCGDSEVCWSPFQEQKSYTLHANTHKAYFTPGGFAVSESVDTGVFDRLCLGKRGQKVCTIATLWYTDYTVETARTVPCHPDRCDYRGWGEEKIIRAPNSLHNGYVEYFCGLDADCGDQGQEVWIAGPAIGPPAPAALAERQSCVPGGSCTKVEGDGNPHQWILHKQLSAKKDCGDTYCVVDEGDQIDYTIHANTHGLDWISGGFDVQESADTGFHNGCTGGGQQPGKSVCTWATMWHTDYTVRGGIANSCDLDGCIEYDDTAIIRSPNKVRNGIEYYCQYDDACGEQGQEVWIGAGADGPPAAARVSVDLEKRCKTDSAITCGTSLVGTGSPKQWILHKQISNPLTCGDGPCYVAPAGETNYVVNWQHDGTDDVTWIAGGFEVTTSLETGILQGAAEVDCQGLPHETVCIYADLWHTLYLVRGSTHEGCEGGCRVLDHNTVITSPNMIKDRVNYVCKHNDECRWSGDAAWIDPHVSGPPPAPEAPVQKRCEEEPGPGSLEGNGSPKQKILHKQISNPVLCADGPCYVLPEGEASYTVNFVKDPPDDDTVWIDGGFDVAKSVDTGIWEGDGLTGCTAPPHQTVCIFADIWHTQYTVRGFNYVRCSQVGGGQPADHTTIFTSPNKITNGVTYKCAHDDQCGNSGDESWTDDLAGTIAAAPPAAALIKRDDPHLVGDGDPHQWILHHQISDSVYCGGFADGPLCTVRTDQETNTELHAIPTDKPWIDGGFAVTRSLHTGILDDLGGLNFCAVEPGHTVCIFADLWYTKYTVREGSSHDFCIGDECQWIITSPNKIKEHVNFYCAHDNECHEKWYEEWWDAHVPGGPP